MNPTARTAPEPARDSVADRQNRIRSSSVHIPAGLIDRVIAERNASGRSNGEIVIAALEHAHGRLGDLVGHRDRTGGSLFTARPSRGVRLADGPLTSLNVRLFEADYTVIDGLVERFGAFSRGHLVSAALGDYLGPGAPR